MVCGMRAKVCGKVYFALRNATYTARGARGSTDAMVTTRRVAQLLRHTFL